jgi:hypothetical protein
MTLALALAALTGPAWAGEATQSGTVLAVDQAAGTIVLEAMGPWQMKDGKTVVGQQSIAVTPSTRFVEVRRAPGAAPSGWVGDYVESPLGAWQVKPGDFVAVSVQPTKPRATALKITVVNTAQP